MAAMGAIMAANQQMIHRNQEMIRRNREMLNRNAARLRARGSTRSRSGHPDHPAKLMIELFVEGNDMIALKSVFNAHPDADTVINAPCKDEDLTYLMIAAGNGNYEMTDFLLDKGADANLTDIYQKTAVHHGIKSGDVTVVRTLLERGGNVNVKDCSGDTPLMEAVKSGSMEMVELLIEKGADVSYGDGGTEKLLEYAKKSGNQEVYKYVKSIDMLQTDGPVVKTTPKKFIEELKGNKDLIQKMAITGALKKACEELSYDDQMDLYHAVRKDITPKLRYELEETIRNNR